MIEKFNKIGGKQEKSHFLMKWMERCHWYMAADPWKASSALPPQVRLPPLRATPKPSPHSPSLNQRCIFSSPFTLKLNLFSWCFQSLTNKMLKCLFVGKKFSEESKRER